MKSDRIKNWPKAERPPRERLLAEGTDKLTDAELTLLYWNIGRRIREDILNKKRAAYGNEILATLSRQLIAEFAVG